MPIVWAIGAIGLFLSHPVANNAGAKSFRDPSSGVTSQLKLCYLHIC